MLRREQRLIKKKLVVAMLHPRAGKRRDQGEALSLTSGSGATEGLARGKAMLGASGVRMLFCGSSCRGAVAFLPIRCSMTSQAANGGGVNKII